MEEDLRRCLLELNDCGARALSSVIAALLLLTLLYILLKPSAKLPPGPRFALPLIGHLHLLLGSVHPHRSLARMGHRYGPLFSLKLGSIPFVVACTPEAARQILRIHDQAFAYRPRGASADHIYGPYSGILMSEPGPYLRFLRHLCTSELFGLHALEQFKPIRDEEVRALLRSVYADVTTSTCSATDKLVHLRPRVQRTGNGIISRMVIGETSCTALQPILEAMEVLTTTNVGDCLPWIQWADLQGHVKQSKKVGSRLRGALQQMIEQRRQQREGVYEPPADVLDILLSSALTGHQDLQLTDDHIRAVLLDVLAGGSDTSGVVLEWVMAELLANPIQMRKTQEEIEKVISAKKQGEKQKVMVEEEDIQKMPFLQAVVKETMRLHPIGPLLIPREARTACQVMGFEVPAKARAVVNVWAIGRDPTVWDNPNEFKPDRFLDCNINGCGQHFELLPFGSGRRACPGRNLGLLIVHIILASLLHAFVWTPHDTGHDMSEKFGILLTKEVPLLAKATPKLPSQSYD